MAKKEQLKMDKIKRFVTCLVPAYVCNFQCMYCYLNHNTSNHAYKGGIRPFASSAGEIAQYFSLKRMGGVCYFNLCAAGETMLHPELNNFVAALTKEGHYADIVTNGTLSNRFDDLLNKLDREQRKHLFIKFSFHYLELKNRNLMQTFLDNIKKVRNSGVSYSVEITPHDELIPYIEEIKKFSMENFGALPHITVARNEATKDISLLTQYPREEFYKIWSQFDSAMFNFKYKIFNQYRSEFCYAGLWSIAVSLEDGIYRQCYGGDILGNFRNKKKPIKFRAIGKCRKPHCFNGHAFLALGDIPELETPTYTDERDRVTIDNSCWFDTETKQFFNTKLYESNVQYTDIEKKKILTQNSFLFCLNKAKRAFDKISNFTK